MRNPTVPQTQTVQTVIDQLQVNETADPRTRGDLELEDFLEFLDLEEISGLQELLKGPNGTSLQSSSTSDTSTCGQPAPPVVHVDVAENDIVSDDDDKKVEA